jgi:hypothetical protein
MNNDNVFLLEYVLMQLDIVRFVETIRDVGLIKLNEDNEDQWKMKERKVMDTMKVDVHDMLCNEIPMMDQ